MLRPIVTLCTLQKKRAAPWGRSAVHHFDAGSVRVLYVALQAEGQGNHDNTRRNGVGADDPDERKGCGDRFHQHHDAEQHAERAVQDQQIGRASCRERVFGYV